MKKSTIRKYDVRRGPESLFSAMEADSFWLRAIGLLGRSTLDRNQALHIRPCSDVHTWFMRFTIDVIFLDRNGTVLGIRSEVPPFRFVFGPKGAHAVLEVASGVARGVGLQPGDNLSFVEQL